MENSILIREVLTRLYTPAPDGYCGDEDNGQTSAWYVFSALGFYSVCPGSDQYVLGAPLFKRRLSIWRMERKFKFLLRRIVIKVVLYKKSNIMVKITVKISWFILRCSMVPTSSFVWGINLIKNVGSIKPIIPIHCQMKNN